MAMEFVHVTHPQRVLFGRGRVATHLRDEVDRIGARQPLLIASRRDADLVERIAAVLPPVVRIDEVRQHVPIENAEHARLVARESGADVLIAVGGGSATGLAKAIALTDGQPVIAVPTTYSGSEGTDMWGLTENGTKTTGIDRAVLPVSVIYDADLTASLPAELAVASGLNALAHCVDALWAPRADPSTKRWHWKRPERYPRHCARSRVNHQALSTRMRLPVERLRSTAPTSPRWPSPQPVLGCTTRSAMCSAGLSTCLTRTPTPSSFHMFWRSMRPRYRYFPRDWRRFWVTRVTTEAGHPAPSRPSRYCGPMWERPGRWPRSVSGPTTSPRLSTVWWRSRPRRIRRRRPASPSMRCSAPRGRVRPRRNST